MAGCVTDYTEEKAALVIEALRAGRRPGTAARLIDVDRTTLYNWKREHAAFAAAWDDAVAEAVDKVEGVLYDLALSGDIQACVYWLKNHRPEIYDRVTMIKLRILEHSIAGRCRAGSASCADSERYAPSPRLLHPRSRGPHHGHRQ